MKTTLISLSESVYSFGIRCLSGVLKKAGHTSQKILLPRSSEGIRSDSFRYVYQQEVLDQLLTLCADSDLIGLSVMSNNFDNAIQITDFLHQHSSALVIWGGIHCTVSPEECLEYADLVCVGEGEDAILELVEHLAAQKDPDGVQNIWFKRNGEIQRNTLRIPSSDLDQYPFPDYDLENEYVLHEGKIKKTTPELLKYYLSWPFGTNSEVTYLAITSRGCSWSCTYCVNNALRNTYHKEWRVRRHSVAYIIAELQQITNLYPWIQWIKIDDDTFLDDIDILREFADQYKKLITRPLMITGFQPSMVDEEKINVLIDAGMKRVRMGVETGSIRTMHKVYLRPGSIKQLKNAFAVFHKFHHQIDPPMYDFITDNPWETDEDVLQTLQLIMDIPRPFEILLYSLTFYPGTHLYERAIKEGLIGDVKNDVYRKNFLVSDHTYFNGIYKLFQSKSAPLWVMKILLSERLVKMKRVGLVFAIYRFFYLFNLFVAGMHAVRHGNWIAIKQGLRARFKRKGTSYSMEAS